MTDKPIPWGTLPEEDHLLVFKTMQAQVTALVASDKIFDTQVSDIKQSVGEIKESVRDLPMLIGEIRAGQTFHGSQIKELQIRGETIDENKADIKLIKADLVEVKETIIPDGKILFQQLSDDFEEHQERYKKLFWTLMTALFGLACFIGKDYVLPWVISLLHK